MRGLAIAVTLLFLAAVIPTVNGAQPSPSNNILWGHGADSDGETIWMNPDKGDEAATDTANGPGYCPPPFSTNANGCTVAGQARPTGDFDHTFTLEMDPGLGQPFDLDPEGLVEFSIYLGASSGSCTGAMDVKLAAGDVTVAEVLGASVSYDSGYVLHRETVAPAAAAVDGTANLVWTIHVKCTGTGLFLGVHDDLGKSNIVLPIPQPAPEPEPEPEPPAGNETGKEDGNETGNQTTGSGNQPDDSHDEPSQNEDGNETSNPVDDSHGDETSDDGGGKGLPGPGAPLFVGTLALLAALRRR